MIGFDASDNRGSHVRLVVFFAKMPDCRSGGDIHGAADFFKAKNQVIPANFAGVPRFAQIAYYLEDLFGVVVEYEKDLLALDNHANFALIGFGIVPFVELNVLHLRNHVPFYVSLEGLGQLGEGFC